MNHALTRVAIVTTLFIATATSNALANCQWTHGSIGQTIQSTSDRLKQYAKCNTKHTCQALESELSQTVSLMKTATRSCGAHVLTAENQSMIGFFDSRFNLIRKQKSTYQGTKVAQTPAPTPIRIPHESKSAVPQTKMAIPPVAYEELWEDELIEKTAKQLIPHRLAAPKPQARTPHNPAHVQQQRLIKQRKQLLIQQNKIRLEHARQRRLQHIFNQKRLLQKQLQQQRAKVIRLNRQRVQKQRIARIKAARQ